MRARRGDGGARGGGADAACAQVAALQGYLLKNKTRPRESVEEVEAWVVKERETRAKLKKEKEEKKRKKEENSAYDLKGAAGRKNDKKKDDVEVEGQGLMLFEDEE